MKTLASFGGGKKLTTRFFYVSQGAVVFQKCASCSLDFLAVITSQQVYSMIL